jgi:hypothetical protein
MSNEELSESIKYKSVVTKYQANGSKTYKLDHLDFSKSPSSSFETKDKEGNVSQITFKEYYRTKHNVTIKDEN